MTSILGPIDVVTAHWRGLSDLRNGKGRRPDVLARIVVVGVPAALLVAALVFDWGLKAVAASLIGGFALIAGVLIAVFAQLANWRTRLDDRAQFRPNSEAPARRLVDAAVAHTLIGVLASALGAAVAVLIELGVPGTPVWSAIGASVSGYLLVVLLLIVNTSYLAYNANIDPSVRELDEDLSKPDPERVEVSHSD